MRWELRYGRGGWVRVDAEDVPGPLYLRYRLERGFLVLCELYLDAHDAEVSAKTLAALNISDVTRFLQQDGFDGVTFNIGQPGPDLSRLASYFGHGFGHAGQHWVSDSMWAQYPGSGVTQPPPASFEPIAERRVPEPVQRPVDGLTDEFLRSIAVNYLYWVSEGRHPALTIKEQIGAGYTIRTVRSWIKKARDEEFLPPTTQGKMS